MMIDFEISIGSCLPIYRQIIDLVRCGVTNGTLVVGDRLPSVRTLANRLDVNPNTVARAFSELSREGVLESRHRRGMFVAKRKNIYTKAERNRRLGAALDAFVGEVLLLDFSPTEIEAALDNRLDGIIAVGQKGG